MILPPDLLPIIYPTIFIENLNHEQHRQTGALLAPNYFATSSSSTTCRLGLSIVTGIDLELNVWNDNRWNRLSLFNVLHLPDAGNKFAINRLINYRNQET
jgi:hypothetical protein